MARNARLSNTFLLAPLLLTLMFMTSADQDGFLPGLLRSWAKQAHVRSERLRPVSAIVKEEAEGPPSKGKDDIQGHNNHAGFDVSLLALPVGEKGVSGAAMWLAFPKVPSDEPLAGP
mmetsp:Transcript_123108/g.245075  ORF Transcript_123108/g.245075 Transcript_123108/m.245075 type:complete len:117 (-) Transcript_123108:404-754(-)